MAACDCFVQKGDKMMFLTLNNFLTSVDVIAKELLDIISQHFQKLAHHFDYIILLNMRILQMKPL